MVWTEELEALNWSDNVEGITDDTADIIGKDLQTNTPITVTNAPGRQDSPAIAGSVVVWQQRENRCFDCNHNIVAKDLSTGITYEVATGPADQVYPAIAGKTVAWLESDDSSISIVTRDLESDSVLQVTSFSLGASQPYTTLLAPRISDEYVLWGELGETDTTTRLRPATLQAYDRATGVVQIVAHYQVGATTLTEYSLDKDKVVWYDGGLHVRDLGSKESFVLNTPEVLSLTLQDGYVLWSARPEFNGFDIYGVSLDHPTIVPLVIGEGNQWGAAIAGEWLVWANDGGPEAGRISHKPLAEIFAKLSNP